MLVIANTEYSYELKKATKKKNKKGASIEEEVGDNELQRDNFGSNIEEISIGDLKKTEKETDAADRDEEQNRDNGKANNDNFEAEEVTCKELKNNLLDRGCVRKLYLNKVIAKKKNKDGRSQIRI